MIPSLTSLTRQTSIGPQLVIRRQPSSLEEALKYWDHENECVPPLSGPPKYVERTIYAVQLWVPRYILNWQVKELRRQLIGYVQDTNISEALQDMFTQTYRLNIRREEGFNPFDPENMEGFLMEDIDDWDYQERIDRDTERAIAAFKDSCFRLYVAAINDVKQRNGNYERWLKMLEHVHLTVGTTARFDTSTYPELAAPFEAYTNAVSMVYNQDGSVEKPQYVPTLQNVFEYTRTTYTDFGNKLHFRR